MSAHFPSDAELAARARDWRRSALRAICDSVEPWDLGVVARSSRYPEYYEFNVVQVRVNPDGDVRRLLDFADRALAGVEHRRIDFEHAGHAEALRPEFERRGWKATRLVHMWSQDKPAARGDAYVQEVSYDAVQQLRIDWHEEDFPGADGSAFYGQAREVSLARDARVLAIFDDGAPIAYSQIECVGDAAEIMDVYVRADRRGHGLGTAVTSAAIRSAAPVRDLWITADDEDRPKHLYARLGFRPVTLQLQFLRLP